jgi:hypothetical protein
MASGGLVLYEPIKETVAIKSDIALFQAEKFKLKAEIDRIIIEKEKIELKEAKKLLEFENEILRNDLAMVKNSQETISGIYADATQTFELAVNMKESKVKSTSEDQLVTATDVRADHEQVNNLKNQIKKLKEEIRNSDTNVIAISNRIRKNLISKKKINIQYSKDSLKVATRLNQTLVGLGANIEKIRSVSLANNVVKYRVGNKAAASEVKQIFDEIGIKGTTLSQLNEDDILDYDLSLYVSTTMEN